MPTLYNKTTTDKKYGNTRISLMLPASRVAGERGPAVPVTLGTAAPMNISRAAVAADLASGDIEIDPA